MSKIVRAAAVQIAPVLYSREGTVDKVVKKILELGKQGVQFATFPETVVPYYPYFAFIVSQSVRTLSVLARPGTPSSSTWPPVSRPIKMRSIMYD